MFELSISNLVDSGRLNPERYYILKEFACYWTDARLLKQTCSHFFCTYRSLMQLTVLHRTNNPAAPA